LSIQQISIIIQFKNFIQNFYTKFLTILDFELWFVADISIESKIF